MKKTNTTAKATDSPADGGMSTRGKKIMSETPVWKGLLQMSMPAMIMMLIFGGYMFADNLLAVQLAPSHYGHGDGNTVRMYMSAFNPINALITAFALMIGMGISTRVSINLGAKRGQRAINTLKTGSMVGMAMSIVLVPVLLLIAKPWMASQYPSTIAKHISDVGFQYGWIIIMGLPLTIFNQIISGVFRTEGRNAEMLFPMLASVIINLFFDWVFMGPAHMGIEGGAWATFISMVFTTIVYFILIFRNRKSIVQFKNLFGLKFKVISIIGIILVGITPFLRNFAQSITQTVEMNVIKDVSHHVYKASALKELGALQLSKPHEFMEKLAHLSQIGGNSDIMKAKPPAQLEFAVNASSSMQMTLILTGVFPVFALFFPVMFGFAQGGRPIASFNFGAKRMDRVKQVFLYSFIYSTLTAIIIYFLVGWGVGEPLMKALGIEQNIINKSVKVLRIMMISMPMFGFAISAMVLLSSTDRIWLSIIVSSLRGLIFFFPAVYIFKDLAISDPSNEFLFWWFYPALAAASVLTAGVISFFVIRHLDKKVVTLDEKLTVIYKKIADRRKRIIAKRKA